MARRIVLVALAALLPTPTQAQTAAGSKFDPNPLIPSVLPAGGAESPPEPPRPAPTTGPFGVSAHTPDPLLAPSPYRVGNSPPGWYANVDIGLVKPHVSGQVTSGVPLAPGFANPVQPPVASLDWSVSPRFEAGYRLAGGNGDLRVGYRLLATAGTESIGQSVVRSRLDFNVIDFDYVSSEWLRENPVGPFRDLRFVFGVRLASAYLDSSATDPLGRNRFSSSLVGAGPRFGLEWSKPLPSAPVEFYSRFDASGVIGGTRQAFSATGRDDAGALIHATRRDPARGNGAASVGFDCGVAWRPDPAGCWRLVAGYHLQQWWNVGRTDDSNFDLNVQGVFVRAEWRY